MLTPPLCHGVPASTMLMRPFKLKAPSSVIIRPIVNMMLLAWTRCLLVAAVGLIGMPHGHAQSITDRLTGSPDVPWQIDADTVDYDAASTTYHARGNVIIQKQATRLMADAVSFNHKTMTASAVGHVVMTVGGDVLTGDRLELDLERETGVVHEGAVFLKENHFYIRGTRIEKIGKDRYQAEKATITSCDGDRPDWIITGRLVKVTIEGYGSATHAVFRAAGLPIMYTPYLWFPTKTKRQSGLLLPEVGLSERKGFFWEQPLFWAIDDSSDATLYAHPMQKRGTKIGLEYRYAASDTSYGALMADGLKDRQVDDGSPEATQKWGYAGDDFSRPNSDRYWLRGKVDQELGWGALARLDLDIVSDQDYLTEFKEGRNGFDTTRNYFLTDFGRDIDPYDETTRTNRLNVNRTWSQFAFNGDLLWNDNVVNRRWQETDDTLQQLPVIEFDGAKQQALGSDFFWDLDSEYAYLFEQDGDRAHRTDLYPRVYLPLRWKTYLSIEPSAGWRHTAWVMDRHEDETQDRSTYRQIYDFTLDLSTAVSKIMDSPVAAADRIRHRVKPQVIYRYVPNQDQSDLPNFDTAIDRIDDVNAITYSLTNTFTARRAKKSGGAVRVDESTSSEKGQGHESINPYDRLATRGPAAPVLNGTDQSTYEYFRFCRFYLEQTYDITAARDDDPQPFSDIFGELDLNVGRYVGINSDASFDTYARRFSSHNIAAVFADHRGDRLWVEHRYQNNLNESIRGILSVRLTDRLTARGEYERNLLDETDIVKGAGILFTTQCWSVDVYYAMEGEDTRFSFLINLMGLGGFGE